MGEKIEFPEPPFDRQKVRAVVEAEHEASMAFHGAGGNILQLTLDQKDAREAYLATLSEEDRERFETLYREEVEALTVGLNLEADRLERETAVMNAELATQDAAAEALRPFVTGVLIAILIAVLIWIFGS